MRSNLRKLIPFMWNRPCNSGSQCTLYIRDIRQMQRDGFYRVYVGETEIPECLLTGDITTAMDSAGKRHTWSIIHAGGQRGWVPWNYKLLFHCNGATSVKTSVDIFEELCSSMRENYGKCAVVVNSQSWRTTRNNSSSMRTLHHLPSGPLELAPMTCCPTVARTYGHELLQLPFQCAHLSPLNSAWSTVKWFATNNREKYSEAIYSPDTLHKCIYWTELIEGALKKMTKRKWEEAVARTLRSENYYLNEKR